ncbi:MAG: sugar ABC transporter ATP-binding protein [Clostridiales bacterium]|nr:sugar ABC transporter ATP-binding protein [Clostridiales bacterium]
MAQNLLSFKNITKNYSGNTVLKDVNFDVREGEIHALIGENGAGKSTLMNILFGMPVIHTTGGFEGSVEINGKPTVISSPREAMDCGIGMVHQEFMLIPSFTITENIKLNREITRRSLLSRLFGERLRSLDMKAMNADAHKALDILDMDIAEYTMVAGLPVGHMQFIEIAREIDKSAVKLLVFDEPTAVLAEAEAENLLRAIRRLADSGIGVIFISHRLSEIVDVADRVTVLRDGELITTMRTADTNAAEIAEWMVGRRVEIQRDRDERVFDEAPPVLEIRDLWVAMPGEIVKGVDLTVRRGEILGIGGLAGQGKLGIANGVMGVYPASGEVLFEGAPLPLGDCRQVLSMGVGFVSEDRKGAGLLLDESIELNIAFTAMQVHGSFLHGSAFLKLQNDKLVRSHAGKMIADLDIRCNSPAQHTGSLSGGNQQKVCVARALSQNPKLLFVSEPTRGIDIGAKKLVLDLLYKLSKEEGITIVMTSSELVELRSVCDAIAIICEGKVAGVLPPDASNAEFGLLMSGGARHASEGAR